MNTTINDGEAAMRANLQAQETQRKYDLRKKLRDQIEMRLLHNPARLLHQNVEALTDWILNEFVSDFTVPHVSMDQIKTVMGLTPDQIFKLMSFYESETGKRAKDI